MEALVASVLEQKVSTREAFAAWRRLLLRYGEARPGPAPDGMRVLPTPRQAVPGPHPTACASRPRRGSGR
ncbi:hypothetical protein ACFT5C_27505 [Streptomyces sp. NPDC057116]|uniref:hypothetical protein n=1 Tax=Streptomyces sp. NPDC057116 TaxID=3346023 RepID=UPI00362A344C